MESWQLRRHSVTAPIHVGNRTIVHSETDAIPVNVFDAGHLDFEARFYARCQAPAADRCARRSREAPIAIEDENHGRQWSQGIGSARVAHLAAHNELLCMPFVAER